MGQRPGRRRHDAGAFKALTWSDHKSSPSVREKRDDRCLGRGVGITL